MKWEDQINGLAQSLEKGLKKITHKLTGLEEKQGSKTKKWVINSQSEPVLNDSDNAGLKQSDSALTNTIIFGGQNGLMKKNFSAVIPTRVSKFDNLIEDKGFEMGSTILISGGAGTGKTTFSMQSIYNGALRGEKGIYLSFEEQPEKIMVHMKKNFGMDFKTLEKNGLVAIIKIDPATIARSLEESLLAKEGGLKIEPRKIKFPFVPDRICVDSLSALSIAFEKEEIYRKYLRELFESLEASKAVSYVITETEQNPTVYSRTGVEEFLAEGVVVLYNLKKKDKRENALEILKLRSSKHKKGLVPYKFCSNGLEINV